METGFKNRIDAIKLKFLSLPNPDDRYNYLIELGRKSPAYPPELKTPDRIVPGCQSILHLSTEFREGKIFFSIHSDALISQGLAALLVYVYSGESPQTILLNPPTFLQEIGIFASLSPHRSNGLASVYVQMKRESLKYLETSLIKS